MFLSLPVLTAALGASLLRLRRRDCKAKDDEVDRVAVVEEGDDGGEGVSAWVPGPGPDFTQLHNTDVDHVALVLADAMRRSERVTVTYRCSDATQARIEAVIGQICELNQKA